MRSRAIVKRPMIRYRIPTNARKRYVASKRTDGSPSDTPRTSPAGERTTSACGNGLRASCFSGRASEPAVCPSASDDAVARGQARPRRRAVGLDGAQHERAAVAVRRESGAEKLSTLRANETNAIATVPRVSATSATIRSLFATRFTES